jgi:hypothetical protein
MTEQTPDRIWATGNANTGSWNAKMLNPRIAPLQSEYLRSTPAREAAPELLGALEAARDSLSFAISEFTARESVPFEDVELMQERLSVIDAAIAKAKGKA